MSPFRESFWYLCEILGLFVVWRTYRLTVVAALYAVFVPAACIAEGLPCGGFSENSRKPKFFVSIFVWFSLLAVTIAAVLVSESSEQVQEIRTMVIIAVSIATGVVFLSSLGVKFKMSASETAASGTMKSFSTFRPFALTWSDILALMTGPSEAIQMCSVGIVYLLSTPLLLSYLFFHF